MIFLRRQTARPAVPAGPAASVPSAPPRLSKNGAVQEPDRSICRSLRHAQEKQIEDLLYIKEYYPEILEQMKELCGMAAVSVKIKEHGQGLYVKCKIKTEADMITSVIRGTHTKSCISGEKWKDYI